MKKLVVTVCLTLAIFISVRPVDAIYNPLTVANNRFGIHVVDENDLADAAHLVNTSGGDFGYVTLVIREDDRNRDKWQNVFDRLRKLHLIPLVRLATTVRDGNWVKPDPEHINSWADFLDSLNWVTENRYIIIFNEPNHAKEWGGTVDPEAYAAVLKEFSQKLKNKSADFFILPAGLDASAPDAGDTMDEVKFVSRMVTKEPDIFKSIDGWTSHSYPNPGFVGSPNGYGRGSIRTYLWELDQFGAYGIGSLPIFITETGWQHSQGRHFWKNYPAPETVGDFYQTAYRDAWSDPRIVAVTPFLLNYQDEPFDHFSFRAFSSSDFYPLFAKIASMEKTAGTPRQKLSAVFYTERFPQKLVNNSDYTLHVDLENTGQGIIDGREGWEVKIAGLPDGFTSFVNTLATVEPFQRTDVEIRLKTPKISGDFPFLLVLYRRDEQVAKQKMQLTLIPPPSLLVRARTWFWKKAQGNDFSLVVYDKNERALDEAKNVEFLAGEARMNDLYNVIPDEAYRIVLTKQYYLPRQIFAKLSESETRVQFPPLLPLDPSNDGTLNLNDVGAFLNRPLETIGLLISL